MITTWDRDRLALLPTGAGRDIAATALGADDQVAAVVIHGYARGYFAATVEIKGGDIQRVQAAVTAAHPDLNAIVVDYREALT